MKITEGKVDQDGPFEEVNGHPGSILIHAGAICSRVRPTDIFNLPLSGEEVRVTCISKKQAVSNKCLGWLTATLCALPPDSHKHRKGVLKNWMDAHDGTTESSAVEAEGRLVFGPMGDMNSHI
ncbi:uncharacterized protein LOC144819343 [Lissotriton helveticus]